MEKECWFMSFSSLHFTAPINCMMLLLPKSILIKLVAREPAVLYGSLEAKSFAKFNKDNAPQHDGRIDNSDRDKDI